MGSESRMRNLAAAGIAALVVACHSQRPDPPPLVPDVAMATSMRQFRNGKFSAARQGFQRLSFELPTADSVGMTARYYLAECYFAMGQYLDASREFQRVSDDDPNHPLAPDALLRSGDALAAMWSRPELDPTYGEEALAEYRELLARYPDSRAAERVRLKVGRLSDKFAEKMYRVGEFYLRLKAYDSAIIYFRSVAAEYGESRFAPVALLRLAETYQRIDYLEERREICANLRQYYADLDGLAEACPLSPASPPAPDASTP